MSVESRQNNTNAENRNDRTQRRSRRINVAAKICQHYGEKLMAKKKKKNRSEAENKLLFQKREEIFTGG